MSGGTAGKRDSTWGSTGSGTSIVRKTASGRKWTDVLRLCLLWARNVLARMIPGTPGITRLFRQSGDSRAIRLQEKEWERLDRAVRAKMHKDSQWARDVADALNEAGLIWSNEKQCWVGNGIEMYARKAEVMPIWDHRHPHFIDHIMGWNGK